MTTYRRPAVKLRPGETETIEDRRRYLLIIPEDRRPPTSTVKAQEPQATSADTHPYEFPY